MAAEADGRRRKLAEAKNVRLLPSFRALRRFSTPFGILISKIPLSQLINYRGRINEGGENRGIEAENRGKEGEYRKRD